MPGGSALSSSAPNSFANLLAEQPSLYPFITFFFFFFFFFMLLSPLILKKMALRGC